MFADAGFGFSVYSPPVFDLSSSLFFNPAGPAPPPPPPLLPPLHQHAPGGDAIYGHLGDMGQPSLIPEDDLGGEGDLFKAPEPIIEEPLLSLDLIAATISMMPNGENAMDDTIKVSDMGQSEVMYECEKELMEKSATISELVDVKIPMLQVEDVPGELRVLATAAGECSLQKSVSSGCLNSVDWMNGSAARPNFLDFQGQDFEAALGMRRAYSEEDIQSHAKMTY